MSIPKLPKPKYEGTLKEVQERNRQRAQIMQSHFNTKFSAFQGNKLGKQELKSQGLFWADLPLAIYDKSIPPSNNEPLIEQVISAYQKYKESTGYVSFNTLKFATGFSFQEIFAAINALKLRNQIAFTVNRIGENVYVKIKSKQASLKIASELISIAKSLLAFEFPNKNELKKYLKQHPNADKSLHYVQKKQPKKPNKQEIEKEKRIQEAVKKQLNIKKIVNDPENYGAWITDEGNTEVVEPQSHAQYLRDKFEDINTETYEQTYREGYKKGWIRTIFDSDNTDELVVAFNNPNPKAVDTLESVIYAKPWKSFYISTSDPDKNKEKGLTVKTPEEAMEFVKILVNHPEDADSYRNKHNAYYASELLKIAKSLIAYKPSGYGVWILPNGQIKQVKYQGHVDFVRDYFNLKFWELDITAANEKALSQGWIRVIFSRTALNIEFEHPSQKAISSLEDIIYAVKWPTFIILSAHGFDDPDNPDDAMDFIRKRA